MLSLVFDRKTGAVTVNKGSIKASARERLQVTLLEDGVNATIPDTDAIVLQCKPKGQTDGDCVLLEVTLQTGQRNTDLKLYESDLNAATSAVLTLLGIGDGDTTNDAKNPVEVDGYLLLFTDGYTAPIESDTFSVKLITPKYLDTDQPPAAVLITHAARYLPAVTGLTGGGATKADGFATLNITPPALIDLVINDVSSRWLLKTGTDAVDGVGSFRPTDYNASTNAKFWKQLV